MKTQWYELILSHTSFEDNIYIQGNLNTNCLINNSGYSMNIIPVTNAKKINLLENFLKKSTEVKNLESHLEKLKEKLQEYKIDINKAKRKEA